MHLFAGAGGGALGFHRAGFESVGAIDCDPEAVEDLTYLTGEEATLADLAELQPHELRTICPETPDVVFTSPPCKGFSGCLPTKMSKTDEYRQLNSLAERGIWLTLETWKTPPPLIIMENVPRIQSRGREWLDGCEDMLRAYGYACRETTHDCGKLGRLAQHRNRFMLVARHMDQVPEFLHEPPKHPVRGVGDVLGELPVPLPNDDAGGPMHRLPRLAAINWVRLALIPAGGDWRDLPEKVALTPRPGRHNGGYGVNGWSRGSHAVVSEGSVRNTWSSVQDPRVECSPRATVYGVADGSLPSNTVVGNARHDNGEYSVADPRVNCTRREGGHGVKGWGQSSTPVIAQIHNWPAAVADPRVNECYRGAYGVLHPEFPAKTVRGAHEPRLAPASFADVRIQHACRRGNYRVECWADPSHVVIGDARSYKGANVADPRVPAIVGPAFDLEDKSPTHLVIRATDGTWHRPMTTLELAALQGFPTRVGGDWLQLAGGAHSRWRQRIGNAVPPPAAEAIARECADVLEAAAEGKYRLRGTPVWVDGEPQEVQA